MAHFECSRGIGAPGLPGMNRVHLRQLDNGEILAIDLFAMDKFTTQTGLTGPPQFEYREDPEEEGRLRQYFDEVERRMAEDNEAIEEE